MADVKIQAARNEQAKQSKKATLAKLQAKKPRRITISVSLGGETLEMEFQAISSHELDALQSKHTPTTAQQARGMVFNIDTFAPALVAACSYDPQISEAEANEIWNSEAWSTGELQALFNAATDLCMEGLNVPFSDAD